MSSTELRVYSSQVLAMVHNVKNVLEMNDIRCEVRGEHLRIGLGEIPWTESWPELWILELSDLEKAKVLVQELLDAEPPSSGSWNCEECGEQVENQFGECWNCGEPREPKADT